MSTSDTNHASAPATIASPLSANQRRSIAVKNIARAMALEAVEDLDQVALTTAALEEASELLGKDPAMVQRLRQKYHEILASTATTPNKHEPKSMPTPLPGRGRDLDNYDPYAKLDPYESLRDFGADQLRAFLGFQTPARLRQAVAIVQERNPGTKAKTKTKSADMIDYIVEHVAGPGY